MDGLCEWDGRDGWIDGWMDVAVRRPDQPLQGRGRVCSCFERNGSLVFSLLSSSCSRATQSADPVLISHVPTKLLSSASHADLVGVPGWVWRASLGFLRICCALRRSVGLRCGVAYFHVSTRHWFNEHPCLRRKHENSGGRGRGLTLCLLKQAALQRQPR